MSASANQPQKGEQLSEILAWDGAENLFAELVDRYILRAGISGVQPKVLVPEWMPTEPSKATVITQDLIVKSGRKEYPGLAANEFLCMSMAKEAGLVVPEFFLSRDRELFVMRRFDRSTNGTAIGFEDMAVLMGRSAGQKYTGSYADVARAVRIFSSPEYVQDSLLALFDSVTLSCIVGNGDAHLKNFGLLYADPTQDDCRLAPVFDIVNTTSYLPEDVLALTLSGNKSFFASRQGLLDFAQVCDVRDVRSRVEKLLLAAERVMQRETEIVESIPHIADAIGHGADLFKKTFCP
jgi:serine/threonine-protein kinase HipA